MTIFKSINQIIFMPTIGMATEELANGATGVFLAFAWLKYGVNIKLFEYK